MFTLGGGGEPGADEMAVEWTAAGRLVAWCLSLMTLRRGWSGCSPMPGRKKLTTLVLGDAQERALQQAAIAAVQDTASELSPSDSQRAGQITMVISEVFRAPVPYAPLAAWPRLRRAAAGIAGQLAVPDDVGLTGTWQSSAEVLGVPGTVLADRLSVTWCGRSCSADLAANR